MIRTRQVKGTDDYRVVENDKDLAQVKDGVPVYTRRDSLRIAQSINAAQDMAVRMQKMQTELDLHRVRLEDVKSVDLSALSRNSKDVFTSISFEDFDLHEHLKKEPWLTFGESDLRNEQRHCFIGSRMRDGITDPEHDSCYSVHLTLIGLTFLFTYNHVAHFSAFLSPNMSKIRVYEPNFDPTKVKGARRCSDKNCDKHLMLPEGHFQPPVYKYAKAVAGKAVNIMMGPRWDVIEARGKKRAK